MQKFIFIVRRILDILTIMALIGTVLSVKNWFSRYDSFSDGYVPRVYLILPTGSTLSDQAFGPTIHTTSVPGLWEQYHERYDMWSNRAMAWNNSTAPAKSFKVCPILTGPEEWELFARYQHLRPANAYADWKPCFWVNGFRGNLHSGLAAQALLDAAGVLRFIDVVVQYLRKRNNDTHAGSPSFA